MNLDLSWPGFEADIRYGYLRGDIAGPRVHHPQVVLNGPDTTVKRALLAEISRCDSFTFSVAFVSPGAIASLKEHFKDFSGSARIITSDYLAFNSPRAFAELLKLRDLGIDVRIHTATAFHPKGYLFEGAHTITAMVGSSNLTESALAKNHEWNLKVAAAIDSDLGQQFRRLIDQQIAESSPLTQAWIDAYADGYVPPPARPPRRGRVPDDLGALIPSTGDPAPPLILPNGMQREALKEIRRVRDEGRSRAIIVSATGTGKTILSALDVKAASPSRMLFVVHREQILDRTISEYQRVLGGPDTDYGKLTGGSKQGDRRYVFATVQTLSQPGVLHSFEPDAFDYVILDEAHRAGAVTHRRIIDHFTPTFLLGMTATPERTDGFNVFELFDYNVPYEIRLNRALDEGMLSPFHYYGVADVTFEDGTTTDDLTDVTRLIAPERVRHVVAALDDYGQAGVEPRGLIFCSRTSEARALSAELNATPLRGRLLRTVALTGDDSIEHREAMVEELEAGRLDYILTVDVFNEGVDIPTVNQVVMLRQTQSAIVFVQQLGRGLRKVDDKEYLVVIDFIGNYANNFLIPIALFGDESLNKESLRKNLIAAEESGVLPGLSSVQFDKISQQRVLSAITSTSLDSMQRLKEAVLAMRNRVGKPPTLGDFLRFDSVDPVLLATKKEHFPALLNAALKADISLTAVEDRALALLSHEVLPAKRPHEFVVLRALLDRGSLTLAEAAELFADAGLDATDHLVQGAFDTFTLAQHAEADLKRYKHPLAEQAGTRLDLSDAVLEAYTATGAFHDCVNDIIETGSQLVEQRYDTAAAFTPGLQYSRKEVTRLLGWPRKWTSTLYGYKVNEETGACPIFVTLHKADDVSASTAYEDELLNESTMRWFTRSRRNLASGEVKPIVANTVALHVFVKKDDAEGTDFYYLGQARSEAAEETTMLDDHGKSVSVVRMLLHFGEPVPAALFDYFHPTVTA